MSILNRIKKAIRAYRSGPTQSIPTEAEFRAIGFTPFAAEFPRDDLAIRMLAAFNNYPQDKLPDAMKFFPNESTAKAWGRVAQVAKDAVEAERKRCMGVADKWASDKLMPPSDRLTASYIGREIRLPSWPDVPASLSKAKQAEGATQ